MYGLFACMFVYMPHACSVQEGQERASDLELELKMVVTCGMGAENPSQIPYQSSQCSWQLSHVSSPFIKWFIMVNFYIQT